LAPEQRDDPADEEQQPAPQGVRDVVVAAADLRPAREAQVQPGADHRDAERDGQQSHVVGAASPQNRFLHGKTISGCGCAK
jgi:hypothetical protein